ncbi:hypothetical protein BDF19DRAFT_439273, partial [Syncephalis fuscata]
MMKISIAPSLLLPWSLWLAQLWWRPIIIKTFSEATAALNTLKMVPCPAPITSLQKIKNADSYVANATLHILSAAPRLFVKKI